MVNYHRFSEIQDIHYLIRSHRMGSEIIFSVIYLKHKDDMCIRIIVVRKYNMSYQQDTKTCKICLKFG